MNCDEYRKQRILMEGEPNLPDDARLHFADCADCQRYLREQERLRIEIGKLADLEQAPESLRQSVMETVRQRSHREPLRTRRWLALATAIVLLFGTGAALLRYYHARTPTPERLAQEFINDHLNYLPGREQIISNTPQQVESWFQGRVEFPVHVPEVPGASLQDARICDISGRKAALLHYRRSPDDVLISLFVAEEPKAFEQQKKPVTLVASIQGLNSSLWCHRGLVYDVVAALDDPSLQRIAESVQKQAP